MFKIGFIIQWILHIARYSGLTVFLWLFPTPFILPSSFSESLSTMHLCLSVPLFLSISLSLSLSLCLSVCLSLSLSLSLVSPSFKKDLCILFCLDLHFFAIHGYHFRCLCTFLWPVLKTMLQSRQMSALALFPLSTSLMIPSFFPKERHFLFLFTVLALAGIIIMFCSS